MPSDAETYLTHLERLLNSEATRFHKLPPTRPNLPPITAILFEDLPHPGCLTAATYGLSLSHHPDWKFARPELLISLESRDPAWALAIADIAEVHRGTWPFHWGATINFHQPISEASPMSAFFLAMPSLVDRSFTRDEPSIQLTHYKVHLTGMYPLHANELPLFRRLGLERFWHLPDFDPWNPIRPDLSLTHKDEPT